MSIIVKHGPTSTRSPSASRSSSARRRRNHAGVTPRVLEFADALRREGVAIGTSEILDSLAALEQVAWTEPEAVPRGAGRDAGQVARGPAHLRADLRALLLPCRRGRSAAPGCARAAPEDATEDGITGGEQIDYDNLREQILRAIRAGDESAMRDLARLAIAAFGRRGEGSACSASTSSGSAGLWACASEPGGPQSTSGAPIKA